MILQSNVIILLIFASVTRRKTYLFNSNEQFYKRVKILYNLENEFLANCKNIYALPD